MEDEKPEKPVGQRLRVVSVMDVTPGHADHESGPPIAMLTLAHRGEVEQTLMLQLRDIRRLAVDLMAVLAHFGDDDAERIVEQHLGGLRRNEEPVVAGDGAGCDDPLLVQATNSGWKSEANLPVAQPTPMSVTVAFQDATLSPMRLEVLGGYFGRNVRMILYRCFRFGEPIESVAKLVRGDLVQLGQFRDGEVLPTEQWASFFALKAGRIFRIGRRCWRRMASRQVELLVRGKEFHIAPQEPRRRGKRGR